VCIQPIITARRYKRRSGKSGIEIGAGASKFLRCEGFLSKFSQTCPKSCRATFADCFFSFDEDKLVFICFSANFGRHFSKSNTVGRHFVPRFSEILPRYFEILFGFSGILPKFSGIVPGFQQFKTFGGVFAPHAPPPPKPLDTGEARCENETYFLPKNRKRFYFNNKERQHLKYSRNTNLVQWNFRNW